MRFALLIIVLALSACSSPVAQPGASAAGCPQAADTTGWQNIKERGFSFSAPADYRKLEIQGEDSYVGKYAASESRYIDFDYGGFSSDLSELATRSSGDCSLDTQGVKAKVVKYADSPNRIIVAASWRNIKPGLHLTLSASGDNTEDLGRLYAVIRSVRFDP